MLLTFKDLKKRVSSETVTQQQYCILFERLRNKPFWIWNIEAHKQEDIKTKGECCFNHIIGLPQKNGADKPLYQYEKIIFDSLVTQNSNTDSSNKKHLWIKKATGLGISELYTIFFPNALLSNHADSAAAIALFRSSFLGSDGLIGKKAAHPSSIISKLNVLLLGSSGGGSGSLSFPSNHGDIYASSIP
ncbi:MAG: hypothetical protein ACJ71P_15045 [Nitrososphaeraceae archaeon]